MNETFINWRIILIIFFLIKLYYSISILKKIVPKLVKGRILRKYILLTLDKFSLILPIFSLSVLCIYFIQKNYIINGGLLLVITALFFNSIQYYIFGILFQLNKLAEIGSEIKTDKHFGVISKFSNLGVILTNSQGSSFINYKTLFKSGFTKSQTKERIIRNTIKIETSLKQNEILDVLFEFPLLNFSETPNLSKVANSNLWELTFSLEKGVKQSSLLNYLNSNKILTQLN